MYKLQMNVHTRICGVDAVCTAAEREKSNLLFIPHAASAVVARDSDDDANSAGIVQEFHAP